jgi:hypothetical protein
MIAWTQVGLEAVRALIPRFEAKIQRVLDRVWGHGAEAGE